MLLWGLGGRADRGPIEGYPTETGNSTLVMDRIRVIACAQQPRVRSGNGTMLD